jgi:hypothetical protein
LAIKNPYIKDLIEELNEYMYEKIITAISNIVAVINTNNTYLILESEKLNIKNKTKEILNNEVVMIRLHNVDKGTISYCD